MMDSIRAALGVDSSFELPIKGGTHELYMRIQLFQFVDVVLCANLITQNYMHEKNNSAVCQVLHHWICTTY